MDDKQKISNQIIELQKKNNELITKTNTIENEKTELNEKLGNFYVILLSSLLIFFFSLYVLITMINKFI
jgi:hypothetical protein